MWPPAGRRYMGVLMNTIQMQPDSAKVGDWIETRGLHGQTGRRGRVVELIGGDRHRRYRVQWDEQHESIVYPADGVMVLPKRARVRRRA